MAMRLGTGPVFAYESLMAARRWQIYAGRALLIAALLAGLTLVWIEHAAGWTYNPQRALDSHRELARIGQVFCSAILGVELVLVLLVSPAATAGAVCQDKARGGLTHLLVTDLSDAEIVLGKLAARLAAVLGIVACTLPVLVLCTMLGGVDPSAILAGSLVIVGVAALGVSVALAFSVWATKAHEALTATYAAWVLWLLALLVWEELNGRRGLFHAVLRYTHPFWLIFGNRSNPGNLVWSAVFLAGCLALSAALATLATRRLRAATLRRAGRSATRRDPAGRRINDASLLDHNPILWREWHRKRPTGWSRAVWRLYFTLTTLFTILAIFQPHIAPGTAGFAVAIGLLLVSISAATALAEERVQGSLDVVLATPLPSREIVLGKWWGAFRPVPWLALLPACLALGVSFPRGYGVAGIATVLLIGGLVLAYGACIVGLGLLLATWQRRLDRAVALSVTAYLTATVIWPTVLLMVSHSGPNDGLVLFGISPFFGASMPMIPLSWNSPRGGTMIGAGVVLLIMIAIAAIALLRLVLATFDHCLGRVAERAEASP